MISNSRLEIDEKRLVCTSTCTSTEKPRPSRTRTLTPTHILESPLLQNVGTVAFLQIQASSVRPATRS